MIGGTAAKPEVSVVQAHDCTRLHIAVDGLDDAGAGAVLHQVDLGHPGESGHAWLEISALREWARASAAAEWDDRFDAMLSYARSKGWTDESGRMLAAHIERREP